MADLTRLALGMTVFVAASCLGLSSPALAAQETSDYMHQHVTALTAPGLICGDHVCFPDEAHHSPQPVAPVRAH